METRHPSNDNDRTKRHQAPRASEPNDATQRHTPPPATPTAYHNTHRPVSPVASELYRRLRGKPTHATLSRTWYKALFSIVASAMKFIVLIILIVSFVIGGFGAGMLVGYISTNQPLTIADFKDDTVETSFVYDSEGKEIARLTGRENVDRIFVSYDQVRHTYIADAIIAIEDERYYEHSGIDIQRIGSAVLSAMANAGTPTHGGSTITQQTVKMISGQDQRSAQRKIQEWFSAMALEQDLNKEDILEWYINLAPMSNNYVGVQAAAQNYFGKNASELTLVECAFLAGIPKSPAYYNPLRETGRRNAMRRMRIVLGKMYELEMISKEEYDEALNTELVFRSRETQETLTIHSYFVEYAVSEVIKDLQNERNLSYAMAVAAVYNRGYHIYTTQETWVQDILDDTFMQESLFQKDSNAIVDLPEKPDGGMVVINVETGAIAAMQGGFGEKDVNLGINRAVDAYRQPGSAIKPLIDYGPAFETKKIVPAMQFEDKKMPLDPDRPNVDWPRNAGSYLGTISVRRALTASSNVIAVQVWFRVGGEVALDFMRRVGIDRTEEVYPATAIGGFNIGMTPLEMAAAYATFPNEGVYIEPYAYSRVLDSKGNVILQKTAHRQRVYSEETAFFINDILKGVITSGTATGNVRTITNDNGERIDIAGKTGTTDDNRDKWFCGYTPHYAAATWYGYDNRLRTTTILRADLSSAMHIWNYAMQEIHRDLPAASFDRPDSIVAMEVCTLTGFQATDSCRGVNATIRDYFVRGDPLTPRSPCPGHVTPTPTPTPAPEETGNGELED